MCEDCGERPATCHAGGERCMRCYRRFKRRTDPEWAARQRAWKLANRDRVRELDRQYNATHKKVCVECGGPRARSGSKSLCRGCITKRANARSAQIVALYNEGVPVREIAQRMGVSPGALGPDFDRLRKAGRIGYRYKACQEKAAA